MPTITILGVVFPSGVVVDTMRFTGTFFENNHAPALRYALQVIDSNVIVQWTMDEYDPDGDQSQYVTRALELARAIVDPIAFREGVGLLVYLTELVKPDGTQMELIHGHNELRDIVTAFPEEDPGIFQRMLLGDPFLCRAVNDLIFAITLPGSVPVNCARALESLRRIMVPAKDDPTRKKGWALMQQELNVSQSYCSAVTDAAIETRHGSHLRVPEDVVRTALEHSWTIFNRYFEYRRRGNQRLPLSEFSLLS
jgi:hypothetical protein